MPDLSRILRTPLFRCAARLRDCEGGLAFIEFALSLPVLVTLGLCGLETANFAMAHLRVSNIAMLTADNASRVRDSIDEANIVEIMTGGKMSGDSIEFRQNGRIILSSLEATDDDNDANNGHGNNPGGCDSSNPGHGSTCGSQWIRWQRCDGARNVTSVYGGQGTTTLTQVGSGGNALTAAPGSAVMVAEVTYEYQPIVSETILGPRTIRYEAAFMVRQRTNQALTNTSNLTSAQRRTCNHFEA